MKTGTIINKTKDNLLQICKIIDDNGLLSLQELCTKSGLSEWTIRKYTCCLEDKYFKFNFVIHGVQRGSCLPAYRYISPAKDNSRLYFCNLEHPKLAEKLSKFFRPIISQGQARGLRQILRNLFLPENIITEVIETLGYSYNEIYKMRELNETINNR